MKSQLRIGDLIIRVSEDARSLRFLTVQPPFTQERLSAVMEIEDAPDALPSLEHRIGEAVLAFLSAHSSSTHFGLERYRKAGKEYVQSLKRDVASDSSLSEADREFEATLLELDEFDDSWTLERLDEIEGSFKRAASRGAKSAVAYLSDRWPKKRAVLEKRITRK